MSTASKNLSEYDRESIPSCEGLRFALIVSEWNNEITFSLRDGAYNTLLKNGATSSDIEIFDVPGTFELTAGAKLAAEKGTFDAVICLVCVIRGETPHFDYICQGVTQGITSLNIKYDIPFIFGVLTTENILQAQARSGGKYGNKGDEAAITAIKMIALKKKQ